MDEEKSSEEDTESQSDVENKEITNEKENSVNNEKISEKEETIAVEADNKEGITEESAESGYSNSKDTINQDSQDSELTNAENPEPTGEANVQEKEAPVVPKNKEGKEGSFMPIVFIMIISLAIAFSWDKIPFIKNSVHAVLGPTAGALLTWNLTIGMIIIVLIINLITTFIQKYATDQEALRELKKEQKILQEEMKKYKDHPEKVAELSKKQLEFIPKTFKLTSRAVMFTGIPFILFFRWFADVFTTMGDPKFFGVLTWFWFYLIFTMIFSSILRKMLKVV